MNYQQKAEAYVRKEIPELMELSFGCRVHDPLAIDWAKDLMLMAYTPKGKLYFKGPDGSVFRTTSSFLKQVEIIGHPIQPHHWLQAIVEATQDNNWMLNHRNELVNMKNYGNKHFKNAYLIIGTENFYKAFNDIVGI